MTLKDWLKMTPLSREDVAERLGVSLNALERWAAGINRPRLKMAVQIETLTCGLVRPRDFVEGE